VDRIVSTVDPMTDDEINFIRRTSDKKPLDATWNNQTVQRLSATIDNLNLLLDEERAGEDI